MASSDIFPERFVKSRGFTQFRYNITEIEKKMIEGEEPKKFFRYDYVEIKDKITRKKLIDALIRTKIDVNDEFNLVAKDHTSKEYLDYRTFVDGCKIIVDEALGT